MTKKSMIMTFAAIVAAVGPWAARPAMADTKLEATIESILCPTDVDPGHITVLGVEVSLPAGFVIKTGPSGATCADLQVGDRVKVKCTDGTCDTAEAVEWKSSVSAEGPVASADCVNRDDFTLASGVQCNVRADAHVKLKKKHDEPHPPPATRETLFDLLCAPETVLGTTPGTVEVKCEGDDLGNGEIDTFNVDSKK